MLYGLLNQFVQLFNKCRRGEMRNVGEIEMMPVVGDDVITSCLLGTLVLQHVLEVFYGGGYGCHQLLLAEVDNLYNTCHLPKRVVLLIRFIVP